MGKRKSTPSAIIQHGTPGKDTTASIPIHNSSEKKKVKRAKKAKVASNDANSVKPQVPNVQIIEDAAERAEESAQPAQPTESTQVDEPQTNEASGPSENGIEPDDSDLSKENEKNGEEEEGEASTEADAETSWVPVPIELTNFSFDIQFHPIGDLIACSDVSGRISLYQFGNENLRIFRKRIHKESCRTICFSDDGNYLFSGSTDRSLKAIDIPSGKEAYTVPNAHAEAVNALTTKGNFICTGDDAGVVKFWDTRQAKSVFEFKELTDFVSDIHINDSGKVLATSADGQLSIFSLANKKLQYKVDNLDDELLCLADTGKYIVMGSQSGTVASVKWGNYEELARMDNSSHTASVDAILPYDATTVVTGCADGIIRVVKITPAKVLHIVGNHEGFMIEQLGFSKDKSLLASVGHDNFIKFWDINAVLKGPTVQEQEAADLLPAPTTATTNIFTNIYNSLKNEDGTMNTNYNSINYTLNNELTTTVPQREIDESDELPKKKKQMTKGKKKKLTKAQFFSDL